MHYKEVEIQIISGDITDLDVETIVNPANSYGIMGGGVAGSIKRNGGDQIEGEAISKSPISIGDAIITGAGKLKVKHVIHAPTMQEPANPTDLKSIEKAMFAALKKAYDFNISSIAFPGMGTGVGGVPKNEAALIMLVVLKNFIDEKRKFKKVIFVANSTQMYQAFDKSIKKIFI